RLDPGTVSGYLPGWNPRDQHIDAHSRRHETCDADDFIDPDCTSAHTGGNGRCKSSARARGRESALEDRLAFVKGGHDPTANYYFTIDQYSPGDQADHLHRPKI